MDLCRNPDGNGRRRLLITDGRISYVAGSARADRIVSRWPHHSILHPTRATGPNRWRDRRHGSWCLGSHSHRTHVADGHPYGNIFLDDRQSVYAKRDRLRQGRAPALRRHVRAPAHTLVGRHWDRRHPGGKDFTQPCGVRTDPVRRHRRLPGTAPPWSCRAPTLGNISSLGRTRHRQRLHLCLLERHPPMEIASRSARSRDLDVQHLCLHRYPPRLTVRRMVGQCRSLDHQHLPGDCRHDLSRHALCHLAATRYVASTHPRTAHTYPLSPPHHRGNTHAAIRRRTVGSQSCLVCGWSTPDRQSRSPRTVRGRRPVCRTANLQTLHESAWRHSYFVTWWIARHSQSTPGSRCGPRPRRPRLHFSRRPDHQNRNTPAVPAWG